MLVNIIVLVSIFPVLTIEVPVIRNASLVSMSTKITRVFKNRTVEQCFCSSKNHNYSAFNYFLNNQSCEIYQVYPSTYKIEPYPLVDIYFTQSVLPEESKCCMSEWEDLRTRFVSAKPISTYVLKPCCVLLDDQGYLVTAETRTPTIRRFDTITLTPIDSITLSDSSIQFTGLAYLQEAYYGCLSNGTIIVIRSDTLSILGLIHSSALLSPHDILFLNNGNTMILTSTGNRRLVFFNRTGNGKADYSFVFDIQTPHVGPFRFAPVNNRCFQVIFWSSRVILSYSLGTDGLWIYSTFTNSTESSGVGSDLLIDNCSRRWISLYSIPTFAVFDRNGSFLENVNFYNIDAFDASITYNYVLYVASYSFDRIYRIDPQISCD